MLCTDDTSGTCCCSGCEIITGRKGNIGTGATLRCLYLFNTRHIEHHGYWDRQIRLLGQTDTAAGTDRYGREA